MYLLSKDCTNDRSTFVNSLRVSATQIEQEMRKTSRVRLRVDMLDILRDSGLVEDVSEAPVQIEETGCLAGPLI